MALEDVLDGVPRTLAGTWLAIAGALQTMDNSWAHLEGESMLRWSSFFR
jgi:hypothetical protein